MPPHNIFDSDDCDPVPSMGKLFNSLLSSSINTLTPMCNDSAVSPSCDVNETNDEGPHVTFVATPPDPQRPPRIPKTKVSTHRNRRRVGLSIDIPPYPSDPHQPHSVDVDDIDGMNLPPRISCSKNVELRRKSLSERHFFRPVSEDEDSVMIGAKQ